MFYALEAKSGTPLFSLNFKGWPMFSSSAIAGGMLYIGSHQGKLIAIDLTSQKPAWTFENRGFAAEWSRLH
jgi:eukaryotic-like serine/threonine-protein kinase